MTGNVELLNCWTVELTPKVRMYSSNVRRDLGPGTQIRILKFWDCSSEYVPNNRKLRSKGIDIVSFNILLIVLQHQYLHLIPSLVCFSHLYSSSYVPSSLLHWHAGILFLSRRIEVHYSVNDGSWCGNLILTCENIQTNCSSTVTVAITCNDEKCRCNSRLSIGRDIVLQRETFRTSVVHTITGLLRNGLQ